jgi:hypothetical protein
MQFERTWSTTTVEAVKVLFARSDCLPVATAWDGV